MGREWLSLLEIHSNHFAEQQVIMILATGKIFIIHYNNGATANIQHVCQISLAWYPLRYLYRIAILCVYTKSMLDNEFVTYDLLNCMH